jgi:hypothetical protein
MEKHGFEQILQQIAAINSTSPAEVRRQMESAMASALQNPDPTVQQMWNSIPRKGNTPTLDEFMEYLIDQNALLP